MYSDSENFIIPQKDAQHIRKNYYFRRLESSAELQQQAFSPNDDFKLRHILIPATEYPTDTASPQAANVTWQVKIITFASGWNQTTKSDTSK